MPLHKLNVDTLNSNKRSHVHSPLTPVPVAFSVRVISGESGEHHHNTHFHEV